MTSDVKKNPLATKVKHDDCDFVGHFGSDKTADANVVVGMRLVWQACY